MTFARKVYLQLPTPSPADLRADRERVLEAFHADSMTLSAMQTLYPTLKKANYAVTASLSPTDTGWEIMSIGMAIGPGIGILPVQVGLMGMCVYLLSSVIRYPAKYLYQPRTGRTTWPICRPWWWKTSTI